MARAMKIGLWSGLFGLFIIVLFGGKSVLIAGLICGILTGLLGGARAEGDTPLAGIRDGAYAAGVAAVILILANLLRHLFVDQLLGGAAPMMTEVLVFGLIGAALVFVIGIALGAAHFLRGTSSTYATWGVLGVIILVYPFLDRAIQLGWLGIVITSLIFILLALGLNIVVGYAGLLDLGYAAFFAIGAYTGAFLSSSHLGTQLHYDYHMSFWLMIWIAAGVAALFGLILGAPTLPLRGDYLAIVTLGFGEIVPIVFRNLDNVTISIAGLTLLKNFNLTGGDPGNSFNSVQRLFC